jgi:hypothetical protein
MARRRSDDVPRRDRRGLGHRQVSRLGAHLAPRTADPDRRERDAHLPERLDRDEEPGQEQHDGDELGDGEGPGDPERG